MKLCQQTERNFPIFFILGLPLSLFWVKWRCRLSPEAKRACHSLPLLLPGHQAAILKLLNKSHLLQNVVPRRKELRILQSLSSSSSSSFFFFLPEKHLQVNKRRRWSKSLGPCNEEAFWRCDSIEAGILPCQGFKLKPCGGGKRGETIPAPAALTPGIISVQGPS